VTPPPALTVVDVLVFLAVVVPFVSLVRHRSAIPPLPPAIGTAELPVLSVIVPARDEAGTIEAAALAGIDAAVHLAGEGIGERRWTAEQKRRIHDSRFLLAGSARITRSGGVPTAPAGNGCSSLMRTCTSSKAHSGTRSRTRPRRTSII